MTQEKHSKPSNPLTPPSSSFRASNHQYLSPPCCPLKQQQILVLTIFGEHKKHPRGETLVVLEYQLPLLFLSWQEGSHIKRS